MRHIVLISVFLINSKISAQQLLHFNGQSYPATNTWTFRLNGIAIGSVNVSIAKNGDNGFFILAYETNCNSCPIVGNTSIFLEDGTEIKCIDRKIRDYVDGNSKSLYYLTGNEIEKLKNSRIYMIRFSVYYYPEGLESYTANNSNYGIPYNTDEEVTALSQ